MNITVFGDRRVYPSSIIIANKYENGTRTINFEFNDLPQGNKYLVINKDGLSTPFMILDTSLDITNNVTWEAGTFSCNVMVCEGSLEGSLTPTQKVFVSDTFYITVADNKINPNDLSKAPIPGNVEVAYNRLMTLINEVETKLRNGEFKGEKGDKGDAYTHSDEFTNLANQVQSNANKAQENANKATTEAAKATQKATEANQAVTTINSKVLSAFPVGTVISSTNSANPSTYLGGTWEQFAQGRTLVGAGTGNDGSTSMSFTPLSSGGKYKHDHTINVITTDYYGMVASVYLKNGDGSFANGVQYSEKKNGLNVPSNITSSKNADNVNQWSTSATTSGKDTMQPYLAVYYWRRIS